MDSRNFECFDSPLKKKKMEIFLHGLLMALNWHLKYFYYVLFFYMTKQIQHTFVKSLSALRKKEIESLP